MKDPNVSMNAVFNRTLDAGRDLVASIEAARIVRRMREDDPGLLRDWLWCNAEQFVADALGSRIRSRRARMRRVGAAEAFAKAASSGDPTALAPFRVRHVVDEDNTQREVASMTGTDHLFVAQTYDLEARTSQMLAAFHRAVAKRVGADRTTQEVMDESTYMRLYDSIVNSGG